MYILRSLSRRDSMAGFMKKIFGAVGAGKNDNPGSGLCAYLVILKQTHADPSDTGKSDIAKLLAEQDEYIAAVQKLQSGSPKGFLHLVVPEKGTLTAHLLAVCTQEVSKQISAIPGVTNVVASPQIPVRAVMKEKTIKIRPS